MMMKKKKHLKTKKKNNNNNCSCQSKLTEGKDRIHTAKGYPSIPSIHHTSGNLELLIVEELWEDAEISLEGIYSEMRRCLKQLTCDLNNFTQGVNKASLILVSKSQIKTCVSLIHGHILR